jgi:cytochrome c oxidase subunit IV
MASVRRRGSEAALEPRNREQEELAHHPGVRDYVIVAVALAVATAFEVALYYLSLPGALLIFLLLFLMALKFALVVLYFMHLRFDNPLFRRLFVAGLLLALTVYTVVLVSFAIYPGGNQG